MRTRVCINGHESRPNQYLHNPTYWFTCLIMCAWNQWNLFSFCAEPRISCWHLGPIMGSWRVHVRCTLAWPSVETPSRTQRSIVLGIAETEWQQWRFVSVTWWHFCFFTEIFSAWCSGHAFAGAGEVGISDCPDLRDLSYWRLGVASWLWTVACLWHIVRLKVWRIIKHSHLCRSSRYGILALNPLLFRWKFHSSSPKFQEIIEISDQVSPCRDKAQLALGLRWWTRNSWWILCHRWLRITHWHLILIGTGGKSCSIGIVEGL